MPIWRGTRPYQQIPFQFSCHTLSQRGKLAHSEFLDLSGADPSEQFAEALIASCGHVGPVSSTTPALRVHEYPNWPRGSRNYNGLSSASTSGLSIFCRPLNVVYFFHRQFPPWLACNLDAARPAQALKRYDTPFSARNLADCLERLQARTRSFWQSRIFRRKNDGPPLVLWLNIRANFTCGFIESTRLKAIERGTHWAVSY